MPGFLVPNAQQQFLDQNGSPLSSGLVYMFVPGTTVSAITYADQNLSVANPNPIILDAAGATAIWAPAGASFRQVVQDRMGNTIWDRITGVPAS